MRAGDRPLEGLGREEGWAFRAPPYRPPGGQGARREMGPGAPRDFRRRNGLRQADQSGSGRERVGQSQRAWAGGARSGSPGSGRARGVRCAWTPGHLDTWTPRRLGTQTRLG